MTTLYLIFMTLIVAILLLPFLRGAFWGAIGMISAFRHRSYTFLANIAQGAHEGAKVTKLAGSLWTTRFVCVKRGADSTQVIPCAAATDQPVGIAYDVPDALLDPVNVMFLGGGSNETLWGQSAATYAAQMGDYVQSDASGNLILWAATGYAIGRVVNDAPAGDVVEFVPMLSTVAHV